MAVHTLENEQLKIQVSDHGGELLSIVKKATGQEYMWNGDPKFWNRHAPVLFPFVGGLKDKTYRYKGQEYSLGQHGFARDMEFELVSKTENEIWHRLVATEETKKVYPFDFILETGFRLFQNQVIVLWRVQNMSEEKMYFSIGGHPAFLCPLDGGKRAEYQLMFEGVSIVNTRMLENGLAAAGLEQLEFNKVEEYGIKKYGTIAVSEHLFDRDAYIIEGHQSREVALAKPNGSIYLSVKFDAPLFGVWAPKGAEVPFVCIEPWYGRCDGVDFDGTLEEKPYINELEPTAIFSKNYRICIH